MFSKARRVYSYLSIKSPSSLGGAIIRTRVHKVFCIHYIKAANKSCSVSCWPVPFLSRAVPLLPCWLLTGSPTVYSGSKMLPFCCGIFWHLQWSSVQKNVQAANGDSHSLPTWELRSRSRTPPSLYINRIVYKIPIPLAYTNCVCQSF